MSTLSFEEGFGGRESKLLINGHQFTLIKDNGAILAEADNGEQCKFVGCWWNEIRQELAEWQPGRWKSDGSNGS